MIECLGDANCDNCEYAKFYPTTIEEYLEFEKGIKKYPYHSCELFHKTRGIILQLRKIILSSNDKEIIPKLEKSVESFIKERVKEND